VLRFAEGLAPAADPDDDHDLRVATPRLRAALQLFERKRQLAPARAAVKALGDALGEVRELQVQSAWLAAAAGGAADAERRGVEALRGEREAKLPRRVDRLRQALARWASEGAGSVGAASDGLEISGRLAGRRGRKRLARRLRQTSRRAADTAESDDPRTAHRMRIAVKKLRYLAELCQPAFHHEMKALLDRIEPLQETLGQLHDADVHIAVVEKFLVRADRDAQPGGLLLLRDEMARRERLAAELGAAQERLRCEAPLEELRDQLC
jgi:CHAD domain-containing protein